MESKMGIFALLLLLTEAAQSIPTQSAPAQSAPVQSETSGFSLLEQSEWSLQGSMGLLLPQQIHDGLNLHLAFTGGWRLRTPLWLLLEFGAEHSSLNGLTKKLNLPGGALSLRADYSLWLLPLLLGLSLHSEAQPERGWSLELLGGFAWQHSDLRSAVLAGPILEEQREQRWVPMLRARLRRAWVLKRGALNLGMGWQQLFYRAEPLAGVSATGAFVEGGWCLLF